MKRFVFLLLIFGSLFTLNVTAQEITQPFKEVVPPSPTVANLMNFEEVPVSLYTGSPNISIPLFSRPISGNMGINLQLSYNSSGIRVDQRSSWTGTGWSLMAGGTISRTVKDVPDEAQQQATSLNSSQTGIWFNDYHLYETMAQADKEEFLWMANAGSEKYDTQPDVYQFNFMGKTGRFSIVKNSAGVLEPRLISRNEKIRIEPQFNTAQNKIDGFILTDATGYIYEFSAIDGTLSSAVTNSMSQYGNFSTSSGLPTELRSAWHLTSISKKSNVNIPNSKVLLASFNYVAVNESYSTASNLTINLPVGGTPAYSDTPKGNYNKGQILPLTTSTYMGMNVATQKLTSIDLPDSSQIVFTHSLGHPEYGGGAVLDRVTLKSREGMRCTTI